MPLDAKSTGAICGLWVDDAGLAHLAVATSDGGRAEKTETFRPFAWLGDVPLAGELAGLKIETLKTVEE